MKVQILNWKKYMGRGDINHPRWFAFQKELFVEPDMMGRLTPEMITAFCYSCCMALGTKDGECQINPTHLEAYTRLNQQTFLFAMEELEKIQLVHISVRDPYGPVRNPGTVLDSIEGKGSTRTDGNVRTEPYASVPAATTYVPLEELEGGALRKPKREKKPKVELSCEAIPELLAIKEILESRKVSTLLQQKWLKLYHPAAILKGVQKADAWAVARGEEKKNWGQFFNNWLTRDSTGERYAKPAPATPAPAAPQKLSWFAQQERLRAEAEKNGRSE